MIISSKVFINAMTPEEEKSFLKSYFDAWRRQVKIKVEKAEAVQKKLEQKQKLENLIKALRKYQKKKQEEKHTSGAKTQPLKLLHNFKNRFVAQKNTIERLTSKLEEKEHLIEELKLGILDKEALKSLNETKVEIREIFAKCSAKTRCKVAPPADYSEKFMISTQKAPKLVQELEEKALERAKRHEIVVERKRILDETRARLVAEALEKKKTQDEEEKKKQLEMIKERRKQELEREKKRQENKAIFLEKMKKAEELHKRHLLKNALKKLLDEYTAMKMKQETSKRHLKNCILRKSIAAWKRFIEDKYRDKNAKADGCFAKKILTRVMDKWRKLRLERVRANQVAEDYYDFVLLEKSFTQWHRHVCVEFMKQEKQKKLAEMHYNRRIVIHYFYQWRSLPAVIQLEKSKEQKMKKWREKVWEVLPDYKPPSDY
ncbi:inner centromere protein-like [Tribolium madens]|uniref:inner centromere protein-like n=1 Tax=Tribolium madens TaxID=41895 RepID=UPI001CF751C0|nr:inner centromere protein-like [Tribolium madens]